MKIKELNIKNYLGTKERNILFDNMPITFISGDNTSGKTTIIRAIYFALTGKDIVSIERVVNNKISREEYMSVSLLFESKDILYRINRRKRKIDKTITVTFEYKDEQGEWTPFKAKKNSDIQEELSNIVGDYSVLRHTYFMLDEFDNFITTQPYQREKILQTFIRKSLSEYKNISESAEVKRAYLSKELIKLETKKESLVAEISDISITKEETSILSFKKELKDIEKDKKELGIKLQDLNSKKDKLAEIKFQIQELNEVEEKKLKIENLINTSKYNTLSNTEFKEVKEREIIKKNTIKEGQATHKQRGVIIKDKKVEQESIEEDLKNKNNLLNPLNINISEQEGNIKAKNNLIYNNEKNITDSWKEEFTKYKELNLPKLNKELQEKNDMLVTIKSNGQTASKQKEEKEELINTLVKHSSKEHSKCPLCKTGLKGDQLKSVLNILQKEVSESDILIKELREQYVSTYNDVRNIQDNINNAETYKTYIEKKINTEKENKSLKQEVKTIEKSILLLIKDKKDIEKNIEKIQKDLNGTKKDIENLNKQNSDYTNMILSLEYNEIINFEKDKENLKDIENTVIKLNKVIGKFDKEDIETASNISVKIKEIELQIKSKNDIEMSINKNIFISENNIEKKRIFQKTNKKLIEEINKTQKNIEQYSNIKIFYGPKGMQRQKIIQILEVAKSEINPLLATFFDNMAVSFDYSDKNILINIHRQDGEENIIDDINNFSGAQKKALQLIIGMSVAKVVSEYNEADFNTIFIDEQVGKLDDKRQEAIKSLIEYYKKSFNIICITHNKDFINKFDNARKIEL